MIADIKVIDENIGRTVSGIRVLLRLDPGTEGEQSIVGITNASGYASLEIANDEKASTAVVEVDLDSYFAGLGISALQSGITLMLGPPNPMDRIQLACSFTAMSVYARLTLA